MLRQPSITAPLTLADLLGSSLVAIFLAKKLCPRRSPPSRSVARLAIIILARSFRDIPHALAAKGRPNSFDALLARELNYGAAAPLRDAPTPSPNDARAIVATTTSDAPTPSRALSLALSLSLSPATSPTC